MVEQRSPKPQVVGSSPSWPVQYIMSEKISINYKDRLIWAFLIIVWTIALWSISHFSVDNRLAVLAITLMLLAFSSILLSKTDGLRNFFEKIMLIRTESLKVSWANWENTRKTAIMVSILVAVFAVIMWLVDTIFILIIKGML